MVFNTIFTPDFMTSTIFQIFWFIYFWTLLKVKLSEGNDLKVIFSEGNDLKVKFSEGNDLKVIHTERNDLKVILSVK